MSIATYDRELGLTTEHARHVAFAYIVAFVSAFLDHVERLTGRCDYDDYTKRVQPDDPVLQELWHADSTSEHARRLATNDTGVLHELKTKCPGLVGIANACAERMLASYS